MLEISLELLSTKQARISQRDVKQATQLPNPREPAMKNRAALRLITTPSRIVLFLLAFLVIVAPLSVASPPPWQQEKIDYATIGAIRQEGLNRSQAMDHVSWLADVYGPRLTGSPAMDQAKDWVISKFEEWGLDNIHEERFAFGKGWSIERFSAHMLEPQVQPIIGYPKSWSSSTDGVITADVVHVQIESEEDFEQYARGRPGFAHGRRDAGRGRDDAHSGGQGSRWQVE